MPEKYSFDAIGKVHSCYREKFGIPRQPGLVKVPASIEIYQPYGRDEAFRELETFSHTWVMFVFHQSMRESWKPT
ncbi:MAG TPA: TrmO family methyltransferase, partial [Gammaproteobacteria bacterium]